MRRSRQKTLTREGELKSIVRQRKSLVPELVGDLDASCSHSGVCEEVAEALAGTLAMSPDALVRRMHDRAQRGLDTIIPGVAVTDVPVPGEDVHVRGLLQRRRSVLDEMAQTLLKQQVLEGDQLADLARRAREMVKEANDGKV